MKVKRSSKNLLLKYYEDSILKKKEIQELLKASQCFEKYNKEEKTNYAISKMVHKNVMYSLCLLDNSVHLISCAL